MDDDDFNELNRFKWCATKIRSSFYAVREVRVDGKPFRFFMHRVILGLESGDKREGDHRNHRTLDNQRDNIRACTHSQNLMNQRPQRNTSSKFKGVYLYIQKYKDSVYRYWRATIKMNGKRIHLGYHKDEERAARAYDAAALKYHGEFANLNFPSQIRRTA